MSVPAAPAAQRNLTLLLCTLGFALNFWAWALLSPLGPIYVSEGLTADASLLVAVPVLVGSLGRIPIGALTDRYGAKLMFPLVSALTIVPVLFLGLVGQYTYATLLVGGFFLGIAGTTFAIGLPHVNAWFPPEKRGMATGIYGAGMGGTAISAFTTVPLYENVHPTAPFVATAIALALFAVVGFLLLKKPPGWTPSTRNIVAQSAATAKITLTWQACYLYAISFGGYVAFTVFLPTMLINWYALDASDASLRMAGFVIVAVIMRAMGGTVSDRIGSAQTLLVSYAGVIAAAVVMLFYPQDTILVTFVFLLMAAGLGLGSGAVFALVAEASDPQQVGSITGFVGAAGGLGGFVPPLLMGALFGAMGEVGYSVGIAFLLVAALGAVVITLRVRKSARQRQAAGAPA